MQFKFQSIWELPYYYSALFGKLIQNKDNLYVMENQKLFDVQIVSVTKTLLNKNKYVKVIKFKFRSYDFKPLYPTPKGCNFTEEKFTALLCVLMLAIFS